MKLDAVVLTFAQEPWPMDAERFDSLARMLTRTGSRRERSVGPCSMMPQWHTLRTLL